jgi:hypothetical protein
MMAASIFAVGFAASISAVASYMNVIEHDRHLGDAWRLLQGQAAHLRALSDSAAEWNGNSSVTLDAFGNPGSTFTVTRVVEKDVPIPSARRITLTASWGERQGTRSTTLVIQR